MQEKTNKWKSWRQHIHKNPELAFEEFQTAQFLLDKLNEIVVEEIFFVAIKFSRWFLVFQYFFFLKISKRTFKNYLAKEDFSDP